MISVFLISLSQSEQRFIDVLFVTLSSYGTTGLSTVSLNSWNWFSKLVIILLMFIGQMGMSTTLSQFKFNSKQNNSKMYVEEYVSLG